MYAAGDIKMNVCRYRDGMNAEHIGTFGLLYRYANKSRRKVPSVILLILLSLLFSTSFKVCAGDEKVVRVDPLGMILDILILVHDILSINSLNLPSTYIDFFFHTALSQPTSTYLDVDDDAPIALRNHTTSLMRWHKIQFSSSSSNDADECDEFHKSGKFLCLYIYVQFSQFYTMQ